MREKIKQIIKKEIENNPQIENWHCLNTKNLKEHLIDPLEEKYECFDEEDGFEMLWTVLKEKPEKDDGYVIFFDPEIEEFGLGIYTKSGLKKNIGIHGSFLETLNGM